MGEIIKRNVVERERGYLYYIDGQGNLGRAKLKIGGTKGRRWATKQTKTKD